MALSRAPGEWRWEWRGDAWWHVNDELRIEDGPHKSYVEDHPPYSARQQALDELVMRALDVAASQTYLKYHPEDLAETAEMRTKVKALNDAVAVYARGMRAVEDRPNPLVPERSPA